jgi:pyruvate dehydrogenase E1 component
LRQTLRAQDILAERYGIAADVWSVTSYKELRREALECERWNLLHPAQPPRRSYIEQILENEKGVFIAASDYMKSVPDSIARWVSGGLHSLGTDGFGHSDSRPSLRRYFEVDAEFITLAALYQLMKHGQMEADLVRKAIDELGLDPEKRDPMRS